MRILGRFALVALLLLGAVACKHNKHANTTVRNRAAFDFPCSKDELTLRVADVQGARHLATQIAAYGCDKKAVYVYVPDTNTWILNGAVSEIPADFEMAENVTESTDKKRDNKKAAKAEKHGDMNHGASAEAAAAEPEPAPESP